MGAHQSTPENQANSAKNSQKKLRKIGEQQHASESASNLKEDAKSKIEDVSQQVKETLNDPKERVAKVMESARKTLNTGLDEGVSHAKDALYEGKKYGHRLVVRLEDTVSWQPLSSVATAFGVGFLSAGMIKILRNKNRKNKASHQQA